MIYISIIIENIVAIVSLKNYLLDQERTKKIKVCILPSLIPSLMLFLSLCRSEFLTTEGRRMADSIFLLSEELLFTLLARQVYWQ